MSKPNNNPLQEAPGDASSELLLLTAILQDLSTSLDLDTTLAHAAELVQRYLDAEGVSLFLLENGDTELVCKLSASTPSIAGIRIGADCGVVGRALREDRTQMVQEALSDPDFYRGVDATTGTTTRSLLCAPLRVRTHRIGAIEAINKRGGNGRFEESDRVLLTVLATAVAMAIHNARMAQALVLHERTQREVELAREIQAGLLPRRTDAYTVYGINLPARMVSGDFYDHFALADGRVCFALGDVSGKGINASLLMAKTTSLFRCLGKQIDSPAQLLSVINRELHATATRGMFVTMVCGVYDPPRGLITLANAGHQPPLHLGADQRVHAQEIASPPLGVLDEIAPEAYTLNLDGGSLYVFTDGLTECWIERGRQLGVEGVEDRIRAFAAVEAPRRLGEIVESVIAWKREQSGYLFDDITMLLVAGS